MNMEICQNYMNQIDKEYVELIILSAKAIGLQYNKEKSMVKENHAWFGLWIDGTSESKMGHHWNPLANNDDAMQLMTTLRINVMYRENTHGLWVIAECNGILFCPELVGEFEAKSTRRAIVRAAAAVGKSMK